MKKLVLTFESHFFAIKAKRELDDTFTLASTPRLVSSTCASCLINNNNQKCDIINKDRYLKLQGLEGIYIIDGLNKEVVYEK